MKNITRIILVIASLVLCAGMVSGCKNGKDPRSKEIYKIHHFENNPYVAEVWWGDDYDPEIARKNMCAKFNDPGKGGCSSWRKENFHGRNIDWTMRDYATIIIHMPRTGKVKYASVSLIAGAPNALKSYIDDNELIPESDRTWFPAAVVDGINECGLCVNHNIVPYDGRPCELNGELPSVMLPRFVLDNCATAQEAIDLLREMTVTQAAVRIANDYSHFFLSDPSESFVIEWINGEFCATKFENDGNGNFFSANGLPAIMTNYFVGEAEKYGFKTQEFFQNHTTATGVERAERINAQLPDAKTVEDHLNICKSVWYRQFCQGKTDWATESASNVGYDKASGKAFWFYPNPEDIHWMENGDVYAAVKELHNSGCLENYYNDFNSTWDKVLPDNNYWFTQHSVVYDIAAKKGYIIAQEGLYSPEVIEINI